MKSKIVILLIISLTGFFLYRHFFTENMIIGTYVNENYNNKSSIVDVPKQLDTLIIFSDNKFKNSYWGNGTYKLSYSISGTKISFIYDYEFGKAQFKSTVNRSFFESPKICLNKDLEYYYKKIK